MTAYISLLQKYQEIELLNSLQSLLYWDMNTYMPPQALEFRTKQFQHISQKVHKSYTSPELMQLIVECQKDSSLIPIQQRNVELMRRQVETRTVFPSELVGKMSMQSNRTLEIWKKAKQLNDFHLVQPELEKLFSLNKQAGELLAEKKNIADSFDAMIDMRDRGFSVKLLTSLFNEVKAFLIPFIRKHQSNQKDFSFLSRPINKGTQIKLVHDLADFLHYDYGRSSGVGRIDEVEHPLTIGCGPQDVRVTTKYQENKVMKAFRSTSHEIGHALHSLQTNPEFREQPIRHLISPSFAESQSRFIENMVVGSEEFWEAYYPRFQDLTEGIFHDIPLEDFYQAINTIKPSCIRIEADEVTYILHIIIRFEIERDLFLGKIEIKDLPEIWNQKYLEYLGIEVSSNTVGVMQDLHWYSQYWGYFHGYAMGDLIATQLCKQLSSDSSNWRESLRLGDFSPIKEWLSTSIHSLGATYDSLDLLQKITKSSISSDSFIEHIKNKYSKLYSH